MPQARVRGGNAATKAKRQSGVSKAAGKLQSTVWAPATHQLSAAILVFEP
jgi:hypothetical protein